MRFLSRWVRPDDEKTWLRARSRADRSCKRGRRPLVEALEPRQLLSLTLTAAGQAAGFGLSTFATGFPNSGGVGPIGITCPNTGGVLVTDHASNSNIRLLPTDTDGQNAASIVPINTFANNNAFGFAQLDGDIYMTQPTAGDVVQLIDNGASTRVVVSGISGASAVLADPFDNLLYVDRSGFGAPIYVVNPIAKTVNVFVNVQADGLALSADGKTLYGAVDGGADAGHILGFDITTKAVVFDSGAIGGGPDGIAVGKGPVAGNLFVNTNGGTLVEVNLVTAAKTVIASGGSRGDLVTVDANNGTLLATQTDRIIRIIPGVFVVPRLTTTTTLDVGPTVSNSGQTVTLTATVAVSGTGAPEGTVTFTIDGQAQAPVRLAEVGGSDQATFTTSTLTPGTHTITAVYGGDTTFASSGSNPVTVTISATPPPALIPTIIGDHVVRMRAKNKKGKPVGKAVVVGFALEYSTAMNATTAGLTANYQVDSTTTTKRVRKKTVPVSQPVAAHAAYDASNDWVTLFIQGKPKFARGGLIKINDSPAGGVSSEGGILLAPRDAEFTILPKATSIKLG